MIGQMNCKEESTSSKVNFTKLHTLLSKAQTFSEFLAERLQKPSSMAEDNRDPETLSAQPIGMTGGTLRPYQIEGLQWLISLYENGLNGILADEMGLGKTVQCISFLQFLRERGIMGYFLIVSPLGVVNNWKDEILKFVPSISVCVYHGDKKTRESLRKEFFPAKSYSPPCVSVVIMSFEIAMKDSRVLSSYMWRYLIVDEGHRLKNLNCRLLKELKSFQSDNRLLITGTPLQNNLVELWSLLNFLLPEVFENVDDFINWFDMSSPTCDGGEPMKDEAETQRMVVQLHAVLKPLLLRRLKADVEKDLPPKREYLIKIPLTSLQVQYYNAIINGTLRELISDQALKLSQKK